MTTTSDDAAHSRETGSQAGDETGHDLGADWFTHDDLPGTDRRTKVIALWGAAVVVAILVATVLLVRLTDTGAGAATDPASAAKQWLTKVVQGRRPDSPSSCVGPAYTSTLVAADNRSRVTVGTVQRTRTDHWTVTMTIASPRQAVPVHVERHSGSYVVC